jgi:hypothetical protein
MSGETPTARDERTLSAPFFQCRSQAAAAHPADDPAAGTGATEVATDLVSPTRFGLGSAVFMMLTVFPSAVSTPRISHGHRRGVPQRQATLTIRQHAATPTDKKASSNRLKGTPRTMSLHMNAAPVAGQKKPSKLPQCHMLIYRPLSVQTSTRSKTTVNREMQIQHARQCA